MPPLGGPSDLGAKRTSENLNTLCISCFASQRSFLQKTNIEHRDEIKLNKEKEKERNDVYVRDGTKLNKEKEKEGEDVVWNRKENCWDHFN